MVMFASCEATTDNGDGDGNDTPQTSEELIAAIDKKFEDIISTDWAYSSFEPSADMVTAKDNDDTTASTIITTAEAAKPFGPVVSFTESEGVVTPSVSFVYDGELSDLLYAYEVATFGFDMGFYFGPDETNLAQICRTVATGFAADDLGIDDITSEETGKLIFTFTQNDLSALEYDDIVLSQNVLISGNNDKIYIDEDGKLVVEVTNASYGVSKFYYTAVE